MKTIKLLILLFFISSTTFAQRVLSEDERQSILSNSDFKQKCEWAVRDYAAYWSIHDGSNLATEALRLKWARDRVISVKLLTLGVSDPHMVEIFLNASKGKTLSLAAAPVSDATIIASWVSGNVFDEFVGNYFQVLGREVEIELGK